MRRTGVRRAIAAGAVAVALLPAARAAASSGRSSSAGADGGAAETYVVRPGDTVWALAERFGHGANPLGLVDAIEAANSLDPGRLVPGQVLRIPAG